MRTLRHKVVLGIAVALAGCGRDALWGGGGELPGPVVRDSSGVRIVENAALPDAHWVAGAETLFTLGWGPRDPTFSWVQSGRILPDGGAIVGEYGAGSIYRIGPDGSVLDTWGRKGEGPGEYQAIDAILTSGDTIIVSDGRLRRVTVLSMQGEVLAIRPLPGSFVHQVSSILADGRVLLIPGEGYSGVAETRPEWVFEEQPILGADLTSGSADTLASLPHLLRWYGTRAGSPGPMSVMGRAGGFEGGFAWARGDQREVRWYDPSGSLVQVARWDEDPALVTPEVRLQMTRFIEESFRSQGADEAVVTRRVAELEEGLDRREGPMPYWNMFFVDRGGNAWLRRYVMPGEWPDQWRVFASDGSVIGWVELPDVLAILDVTDDRILAVRQDKLDVQAVVLLELSKG